MNDIPTELAVLLAQMESHRDVMINIASGPEWRAGEADTILRLAAAADAKFPDYMIYYGHIRAAALCQRSIAMDTPTVVPPKKKRRQK